MNDLYRNARSYCTRWHKTLDGHLQIAHDILLEDQKN